MNYLVITGHGNYASGVKSALELIIGHRDNVLAFDFLKEESEEQFSLKFKDLDKNNNYLFACDLMGGTPYKVVSRLDLTKEILIGTNLGGMLDTVLKIDKLSLNEGMLYENAIAQMLVANKHKLYFYTRYKALRYLKWVSG